MSLLQESEDGDRRSNNSVKKNRGLSKTRIHRTKEVFITYDKAVQKENVL